MKLTGHPVQTGQARRGRSTELTTLSMSNGLPGNGISFYIVPHGSPVPPKREGALSGQMVIFPKWNPLTPIPPASKKGKEVPFPSPGAMTKRYRIFEEIFFIIGLDINKKTDKPKLASHWKLSGMTIEEDDKIYFSCIYYPLFPVLNLPSLSFFKLESQEFSTPYAYLSYC